MTQWLERSGRDFSVPSTIESANSVFRGHVAHLYALLASFEGNGPVVVVPDTNALYRNLDVAPWKSTLGTDRYTVLLVIEVLKEMDKHKVDHRNPELREKARKLNSRLKDWRCRGNITEGVPVEDKVYVRVFAREPSFEQALPWLDPSISDDRIIASVLEFQSQNPAMDIRVVSGDTAMMTKCDMAGVESADLPDKA